MPLISIITVCKNADSLLEESILSLRQQTFKDYEFLVVDGNSNDGTREVLFKNSDMISRQLCEEDSGIYEAMNKGIKMSTGAYIYFLNAGDVFYSDDTLAVIAGFLHKDSDSIIYGDVLTIGQHIDDTNVLMHNDYDFVSLLRRPINHQGVFTARRVFERNGFFDISFRIRGDHDWELRNYRDKEISFHYVPVIVAKYKKEGFTTRNKNLFGMKERKMLIRKNVSFLSISLYRLFSFSGLIDKSRVVRKFMNYMFLNV
jgi:glycosyltransferase involved in cell wall biosynthesis